MRRKTRSDGKPTRYERAKAAALKPDSEKNPKRVAASRKAVAARKPNQAAIAALPDEQEALQAAGLCGRKNRAWRVDYHEPRPADDPDQPDRRLHRIKTFTTREKAEAFLGEVALPQDPEAEMRKNGKYEWCHERPTKQQAAKQLEGRKPACKVHGGLNPRGPASHMWGSGEALPGAYSGVLGGNYLAAYHRALQSGELPNLREQMALVGVREDELVRMIAERRRELGDVPTAWRRAQALAKACRRVLGTGATKLLVASGGLDEFLGPFGELEDLLAKGASHDAQWDDLLKNVIPAKRRLVEVENRMVAASEAFIPIEEAMATSARMIEAARIVFGAQGDLMNRFVTLLEDVLVGRALREPAPINVTRARVMAVGDGEGEGDEDLEKG